MSIFKHHIYMHSEIRRRNLNGAALMYFNWILKGNDLSDGEGTEHCSL